MHSTRATGGTVVAWGQNVAGQSAILPRLTNIVAIAPGLALKNDGSLLAWGPNSYGQTNIPPGLTNIAAICAAGDYDVVLTSNGTVIAWGDNPASETNIPPGLANVQAISASDFLTLALKRDGTVVAWGGDNAWGELNVPPGLSNVVAVCSGGDHAFALRNDGTVVGWGANYAGQMEIPPWLTHVVAIDDCLALKQDGTVVAWGDRAVAGPNVAAGLTNIRAIAVGPYLCLALKQDGTVVAWGTDTFGDTDVPVGLTNVTAIAAGGAYQSLALNNGAPAIITQPTNQTVYSGRTALFNFRAAGTSPLTYTLLSDGTAIAKSTDVPPSLVNVQPAEAGLYDVVVSNGLGSVTTSNVALIVLNAGPIITQQPLAQTALPGWDPVFSVGSSGSLPATYQWRLNGTNLPGATDSFLTLGNVELAQAGRYDVALTNAFGYATSTSAVLTVTPSFVMEWQAGSMFAPAGVTNVLSCAAGPDFGLAIKADGGVAAWGDDTYGQTSIPTIRSNDVSLPLITNAVAVACGVAHSLVLTSDGTVTAWGAGTLNANYPPNYGQSEVPTGLSNVVAIAAGGYSSLALRADGTVWGWGDDRYGQTTPPADLTNAVAIAANSFFALALRADGTIVAWGSDIYGQTNTPAGLSNVVAIAAGLTYGLALKSDGSVVAWGKDSLGKAMLVPVLGSVLAIAASTEVSLALKEDGTVSAWGNLNIVDAPFEPSALWPSASNVVAVAAAGNMSLGLVRSSPQKALLAQPAVIQGGFRVSLPTTSGRVYQLQFKSSLRAANWTSLPLVPGNGGLQTLHDPSAPAAQRFYRVLCW